MGVQAKNESCPPKTLREQNRINITLVISSAVSEACQPASYLRPPRTSDCKREMKSTFQSSKSLMSVALLNTFTAGWRMYALRKEYKIT